MLRLTALLCISASILTGCSSRGDESALESAAVIQAQPGMVVVNGNDVRLPGCLWRIRVPDAFEPGSAALLVQRRVAQPGDDVIVAVLNDSEDRITYGMSAFLRESGSGRPVPGSGPDFVPAVGFSAEPGQIGNCLTIHVPERLVPGRYEAVVDQVSRVEGREVTAPIRIG